MLNWIRRKITAKASDAATSSADPASRQVGLPKTIKEQGDEHLRAGRYADAERFYRQVMESDAQYPPAVVNLGFVLREQGRLTEAREVLERAIRIAAEDASRRSCFLTKQHHSKLQ